MIETCTTPTHGAARTWPASPNATGWRRSKRWAWSTWAVKQRATCRGPFTFWDYRMGAFHRGWGLRIDLLLGSASLRERLVSVEVDREERKPTTGEGKPSDHAPVIGTFREPA